MGDMIYITVVWMPSIKTLYAGDVLFNQAHPICNAEERLEWIKEIDNIEKMLKFNPLLELCDKIPEIGERIKVPTGPLAGIEGKILRLKGKSHFVLEVDEWEKCIVLPYNVLSK